MKEQVWQRIDSLSQDLWDLALRIHAHPELGFEEYQAAAWLTEALENGGFRVEREWAGFHRFPGRTSRGKTRAQDRHPR
jgi:metal-dependent amidase/aminoacylase/carboxypeptidase family protein